MTTSLHPLLEISRAFSQTPSVVQACRTPCPRTACCRTNPAAHNQLPPTVQACAAHRFVPAHWLLLKETLLREVARSGPLSRNEVKSMFRLEPARAVKLYDLAVAQGWIPTKGVGAAAAAAATDMKPEPNK
jgi:hypothetical protein